MKTISKALAKKSVVAVAAGAMAVTSAAPAYARDRHDDRLSTGEVIAGAVIIGGLAAILSSGNKRDRYRDGYRHDNRYDARYDSRRGNGERAVERCIRAAENDARRSGFRYADVTQIRDVERTRYGWRVKGRIEVQGARGYDRRGYGADQGRFSCDVSRGRVQALNYRGIRGLG